MMKDLDFDELDQAVNSLMTGIPKTPVPQDDKEAEKTLTITPTLSDNERPSFATLEQAAAKAGTAIEATEAFSATPAVSTNPLAARRSSGRFMDVVHPSSDMKISTRPAVSREGLQLNPVGSRPVANEPQPTYEPETIAAVPDQTPEVIEQPEPVSAWPDPIDMLSAKALDVEEPAPTVEVDPVVPVIEPAALADLEEPAPLQTPFLADTKVEKRPLGAFTPEQQFDTEDTQLTELGDDLASEQVVADPAESIARLPVDLPDELQHDLIQIESDNGATQNVLNNDDNVIPATQAVPVAASFAAPIITPAPVAPAGPVSIQPQYKEEPSSSKEEHAAIYDTDSYHQPLAHPAKKKSGWLWVLWIILLLALGAGGAAALYYFNII